MTTYRSGANSFLNELQSNTNRRARTENGALSNTSTLDPVLDFFSRAGAMRGQEAAAFALFQKAFDADPQNAIRVLFYLRDIRGGQGERSVFRYILERLDEDFVNKIAHYIPEYGRWDEVPVNATTVEKIIAVQLKEDLANLEKGKPVSLLAKWLPSENAGKASLKRARNVARLLGWTAGEKEYDLGNSTYKKIPNLAPYRRNLSKLRAAIKLLEQQMSAKQWDEIDYSKLPSQAHKKHVKAFFRHSEDRYKNYLNSVEKGEAKINSGTLFAYQLYDMVRYNNNVNEVKAADTLWANLPDYTKGQNALVLADVSGSMSGFPMSVSVSLALYFAERNKGPFKDYFMTFTSESRLQKVTGKTLSEKMRSIESSDWHGSTYIQSAFDAILRAAQAAKASEDEMPKVLYIISDMQFDTPYFPGNNKTNFEVMAEKYKAAGYELPHLVFWNARAGQDSPATKFDGRVTLISGNNQSTFQFVVEGKTPLESMLDILNSERYSNITI